MRAVALCAALVLGGCDFDKPAPAPPHDPPTPWSIERDASTGGIWRFNRETGQLSNCWRREDFVAKVSDVQCSDAPAPGA